MIDQIFYKRKVRLAMIRNVVLVMQHHIAQLLQFMHIEPGNHR